jgi:hypothetical protein
VPTLQSALLSLNTSSGSLGIPKALNTLDEHAGTMDISIVECSLSGMRRINTSASYFFSSLAYITANASTSKPSPSTRALWLLVNCDTNW